MATKIFGDKKIKIKKLAKKDLENVKKFQNFIDSLVEENTQIKKNKKISLKEERNWLQQRLKAIKNHKQVSLVAEVNNKVVGFTNIHLHFGRQEHIGSFNISIRNGYRNLGLGTHLTNEILKLARKELKPRPRMIRLNVLPTNKPALKLYTKFGFKKVAVVPKQFNLNGKLVDEIIMLLYL